MTNDDITTPMLDFINSAPTPAHVVAHTAECFQAAGFAELNLAEPWQLAAGGRYFVRVYGTSLLAFTIGEQMGPLRIAAAHTDSPCFRLKAAPLMPAKGGYRLNVEPYGGMIMRTWLDRPLGLAGRVVTAGPSAFTPQVQLFDFGEPVVTIPSLAIHMDRQVNEAGKLNAQTDMLPLLGLAAEHEQSDWLRTTIAERLGVAPDAILSLELMTYPWERGCALGIGGELLSSPRLDNLTSVWACLEALTRPGAAVPDGVRLVALFDNEEVGSRTKQGAGSTVLPGILRRIYRGRGGEEALECAIADGFMLSCDVAHGLHPNHAEKSDPTTRPLLGQGVVVKQAASQAYAGDAEAIAIVRALAAGSTIRLQDFANRSDSRGGSTLGSIASAIVPIRTMDVGVPILAMHSARETMAGRDEADLLELVAAVLS